MFWEVLPELTIVPNSNASISGPPLTKLLKTSNPNEINNLPNWFTVERNAINLYAILNKYIPVICVDTLLKNFSIFWGHLGRNINDPWISTFRLLQKILSNQSLSNKLFIKYMIKKHRHRRRLTVGLLTIKYNKEKQYELRMQPF